MNHATAEHHVHNALKAEIVTPEGALYSAHVHMLVMPGVEGEFGAMAGHIALIVGLKPGLVVAYDHDMQMIERFFISTGFVEVTDKSVTILVEQAAYLTDYNLSDTNKFIIQLNEDLGFCKNDNETALIKKKIQEAETLLEILKRL